MVAKCHRVYEIYIDLLNRQRQVFRKKIYNKDSAFVDLQGIQEAMCDFGSKTPSKFFGLEEKECFL